MVIHGNSKQENVSEALVRRISFRLEHNEPVLLLVSGGSSAPIAVDVCKRLTGLHPAATERMKWLLTVSLIDERYGQAGHPDSNWTLLESIGLHAEAFMTVPVLGSKAVTNGDLESTVRHYASFLSEGAAKRNAGSMFIAGLFGIGKDGHTAGILPDSPAASDDIEEMAVGYKSALFTRITITPPFFAHIDYAAVWASGTEKRKTLELLENEVPPTIQPAQYLKRIGECDVFTDIDYRTS